MIQIGDYVKNFESSITALVINIREPNQHGAVALDVKMICDKYNRPYKKQKKRLFYLQCVRKVDKPVLVVETIFPQKYEKFRN
jgi:hypothetical protein